MAGSRNASEHEAFRESAVKTYIVEDSPIILDNLVAALQEMTPAQVVGSAGDEESAVEWLTKPGNARDLDLLVIDIFLKGGSGLGVLERAASAGVPGKRVVLTNFASPDMRRRCQELGAHRVFDKSNEVEELIDYCARIGQGGCDTVPGGLGP